jgi:glycerol-3-phosphate acyltransferase PlsY
MSIPVLNLLISAAAGYLLGSANSSLIVGKFYGIDVRKYGSGNAGLTNALRTLGKTAALFVTAGDVLKGVIACLVGLMLVGDLPGIGRLGLMVGGVAAILGHNWPVYFSFKGGKGALTSFSVVMMMDWRIGLILLGIFIIIVAVTRYVSLGSVISAALFPVLSSIPVFQKTTSFIILALLLGLLVVVRHHANIYRLVKGTEAKLGAKKNI